MDKARNLGMKLKLCRIGAGVKLTTLEKKTGIPRSVLSRIENRKTSVKLQNFLDICEALQVNPVVMLCDSETWDPSKVAL